MAKRRQDYTSASIFGSPNSSQLAEVNVTASDRIWFWDVSERKWQLLSIGAGLSISGTTLTGTGAPNTAEYIVAALDGTLTAERLATDTNSVVWDFTTASAATASVRRTVSAKTANYTVLTTDLNTIFTNSGAVGTVIFTIPDSTTCVAGQTSYTFFSQTAQIITLEYASATDQLYGYDPVLGRFASNVAKPLSSSGGRGDAITVTCLSTNVWMAECSGLWTV